MCSNNRGNIAVLMTAIMIAVKSWILSGKPSSKIAVMFPANVTAKEATIFAAKTRQNRGKFFCGSQQSCGQVAAKFRSKTECRLPRLFLTLLQNKFRGKSRGKLTIPL
jgi:hypothetical protein